MGATNRRTRGRVQRNGRVKDVHLTAYCYTWATGLAAEELELVFVRKKCRKDASSIPRWKSSWFEDYLSKATEGLLESKIRKTFLCYLSVHCEQP